MECQYCKNILSTNKALKTHQKTAKYCIELQIGINGVREYMTCDGCAKNFTTKREFKDHIEKCVCKKDKELKLLRKELILKDNKIIELEAQLEIYKNLSSNSQKCIQEIAKQPKTTTNTNTNNNILNLAALDMTSLTEKLTTVINEKMTEQHLLEGQEGVAKLIASCFTLEDGRKLMTCTDVSRGIWKSKDKDGNILKDVKANRIAKAVQPIAVSKADILIKLDDTKRKKIYELRDIQKRKEERQEATEREESFMKGIDKDSSHYRMYKERIDKRNKEAEKDELLESRLITEFSDANELYLLDFEDDEKPFKLFSGKEDIKNLKEDSIKFSNSLITLV
jgi:hypothetical protein